jgi:GTP 3',8-cyclase
MLDNYNRHINYLRISVTDRCNLRCTYCMPAEGIKLVDHNEILSFEEITEIIQVGVSLGINKVRLTGGEPLVRKGIADLVKMISSIDGIDDLSMTTNGILLDKFAEPLVKAGLRRVNISLDTIDPLKYISITRNGGIEKVFRGIEAAKKAGLDPIKINCVIFKNEIERNAQEVARFARENNLQVRFIHQMDLRTGEFSVVEGGEGGNCRICNRLRLTSNGYMKPCLFSGEKYNVRELGIRQAFQLALQNKPECGTYNQSDDFYNIGG